MSKENKTGGRGRVTRDWNCYQENRKQSVDRSKSSPALEDLCAMLGGVIRFSVPRAQQTQLSADQLHRSRFGKSATEITLEFCAIHNHRQRVK